jgi:hypothetical protein
MIGRKGGTSDPEAYQLYLKGLYYWEKRTPETLGKAKDYFEQAIARDPNYVMAYVGLANYYVAVPDYGPIPQSEAAPKAKAQRKLWRLIAPRPKLTPPWQALSGTRLISPRPKLNFSRHSNSTRISPMPITGTGSSCPGWDVTRKLYPIFAAPSNSIP